MPDESSNQSNEGRTFTWLLVALSAVYFLPVVTAIAEHLILGSRHFEQLINRTGFGPFLEKMHLPLKLLIDLFV